jgi:ribokinase
MMHDFITIGGVTEDLTFYTGEGILINNKKDLTKQRLLAFEFGAKIKIDKAFSGFGGGAANAAVCFSRLGFKAACLACVGDDLRGQSIINNFKKEGVDCSLMQKIKGQETGFSFLLVGPGNEHICFSNRAANSDLKITNRELKIIKKSKWVYITSLSGQWEKILDKIFSLTDLKIAWNPGYRQINKGVKVLGKYLKRTECVVVNIDEAIEMVMSDEKYKNKDAKFLNNPKNLLLAISGWGPNIVVITNGSHGADAIAAGEIYHQPIVKERQRADTTGVGDAFGSSFIAGLNLYNCDIIKNSLLLAAKNAAAEIGEQGAQNGLLRKKDIV